jgi:hypothetical protein
MKVAQMSRMALLKKPSALLPIVMSLTALGAVLAHYAMYGMVHEVDEGAAAHIFQLMMVLQVPVVAVFAIKWLPLWPKQALPVLGMQACAALSACLAVFFLT